MVADAGTLWPTFLGKSLNDVPGVGSRSLEKLEKLGIQTIEDALYHLPLRYEDRRQLKKIRELTSGQTEIFVATVLTCGEVVTSRNRRRIFEVIVADDSGRISLKWFNTRHVQWLKQRMPVGQRAVFIGEVKRFSAVAEIHHPDVELIAEDTDLDQLLRQDPLSFGRILPVYPLTQGISQNQIRKIWYHLISQYAPQVQSFLPAAVGAKYQLLPLAEAMSQIHWPAENTDMNLLASGRVRSRQSLVFDEFFFLELGLALKRAGVRIEPGIAFTFSHKYTIPLNKLLPFKLTNAQRRVLGEIKQDMMSAVPMHRLLQGDVGCGKTMVALMSALIAIENSMQVAVVAPTEILAEQHYKTFKHWLDQLQLSTCLLLGSMTAAQKRKLTARIAAGEYDLIVGTHAVLQDSVEFNRLGLGIIDEQHRFGVKQRSILKHKGANPDILVMTATPIPRTLSMTLYGDLSVSVIDELPPGRKPVTTRLIRSEQRQQAYRLLAEEIGQGRQGYIVYPLVEESEKSDLRAATVAAEELKNDIFPHVNIGLLHGQMKSDEKERVMNAFRDGAVQLLVATTVIEVGVDVPNATVMVIEHADRFGLSQLHQLRGRVGRGGEKSYCLLMPSKNYSADAVKRLQVMVDSENGFTIAEADLEIRGPGDFLGTRQAGLPDFRVANLVKDINILEAARQEAFAYVEQTRQLTTKESAPVRQELLRRWGGRLELAAIG